MTHFHRLRFTGPIELFPFEICGLDVKAGTFGINTPSSVAVDDDAAA